jgi:hypothetical protein
LHPDGADTERSDGAIPSVERHAAPAGDGDPARMALDNGGPVGLEDAVDVKQQTASRRC